MTFGEAIEELQLGYKLRRRGWNGTGMFIALQVPDKRSKMKRPYIYISPVGGELVPWVASHTDMLSEDWEIDRP